MMLTVSEDTFKAKLIEFYEFEKNSPDNISYFDDNWLNCMDKWAKFKRHGLALNLQETNNPVESINKQFKHFSDRKHAQNSLAKCLSAIFNFLKSNEINKEFISMKQKNATVIPQGSNPVVCEFYKFTSPVIAKWLSSQ